MDLPSCWHKTTFQWIILNKLNTTFFFSNASIKNYGPQIYE